ncbi:DMT family transporter [Acinetobacter sp. MB5]|uniref:DMT family transporter n=1 Tax=Acinetobacter sp. MB5 TaxID=2069438 RepID=UPI000DD0CC7A|nr:DMT family transporter [Acinetobacter sp. MB5]
MWGKIALTMSAFAANSIFCRLALAERMIDPYSFSLIRILSGIFALILLIHSADVVKPKRENWKGGLCLTGYMFAFSVAYVRLDAGMGALLLFGTVQISMALYAVYKGEKVTWLRGMGLLVAFLGMLVLFLPTTHAPSLFYALMMMVAGLSWVAYSLIGMSAERPIMMTYYNFIWAVPIGVLLSFMSPHSLILHWNGVILAMLSGALTSGLAYALWYDLLKHLDRMTASTLQLSVPCLALLAGVVFLNEVFSLRMLLATVMVLSGILLLIFAGKNKKA